MSVLAAGVELGGTKCVCVLATGPGGVVAEERVPTTSPEETLSAIERVLDRWQAESGFAALGLACFGPLQLKPGAPDYGYITATTKPGWRNTDVARRLGSRYGVPTAIDTDVSGAALAEGRWGGAQGLSSHAYITVGTGVGAGIIVNGRPVMGIGHAEAGHMRVPRFPGDDWKGACTFHGDCVEGLASGFAVEQRTGRNGGELPADHVVWSMVAHAIAGLCHNLVMGSVPERILIGGGVATKQPQILPMVRAMLVESLAGYGDAVALSSQIERYIAPPALGDQAGPMGAIALAMDALAAA
ncbi:MAG: ROK family protein [Sphingomonas oligoaromativorans]|jgi:fructokinase|uniref:ROK family protein n=1 Tax=Sphingomonas oligoaromativorans TaxID=575322 RepID=UPI001ABB814F|nr:ROK family protein [Sphingomonas oligoaromativorans]NIJ31878.1 fructokinase [Sphingomonas oligoaromativorans]